MQEQGFGTVSRVSTEVYNDNGARLSTSADSVLRNGAGTSAAASTQHILGTSHMPPMPPLQAVPNMNSVADHLHSGLHDSDPTTLQPFDLDIVMGMN